MTTEEDFQTAMDESPCDWDLKRIFGDWLEEQGDSRAEGYRALGVRRCSPRTDGGDSPEVKTWFSQEYTSKEFDLPGDWVTCMAEGLKQENMEGHVQPEDCPSYGRAALSLTSEVRWVNFVQRRGAEDAAALAFIKLPPERRLVLLTASGN